MSVALWQAEHVFFRTGLTLASNAAASTAGDLALAGTGGTAANKPAASKVLANTKNGVATEWIGSRFIRLLYVALMSEPKLLFWLPIIAVPG